MAHPPQADPRRHRALLAPRDCQRAECRSGRHRITVRSEGHSRALHEFGAGRAHGDELCSPERTLSGAAETFLPRAGSSVHLNTTVESAEWDEAVSEWSIKTRTGTLVSEFLVIALPFEAMQKLLAASSTLHLTRRTGAQDRPIRTLAHLQRAPLVRSQDHRSGSRRSAGSRDPLDVQQGARCSHGAKSRAAMWNLCESASRSFAALTATSHRAGVEGTRRVFPD